MRFTYTIYNKGYSWNNYWNEGKEAWSGDDPCPIPGEAPPTHHNSEFFPDFLKENIDTDREAEIPAFITEADLHSPCQFGGTNPLDDKAEEPEEVAQSLQMFIEEERRTSHAAVWLLTEDIASTDLVTATHHQTQPCVIDGRIVEDYQEIRWHQAYEWGGFERAWFREFWNDIPTTRR